MASLDTLCPFLVIGASKGSDTFLFSQPPRDTPSRPRHPSLHVLFVPEQSKEMSVRKQCFSGPARTTPRQAHWLSPLLPELSAGAKTSGQWGWGYHGAETAVQDDSGPQEGESNALDPRTRTDAKCNCWAEANRKSPLCERSQSLLPARRWARGHWGVRGPWPAAPTPEGTEAEGPTVQCLYHLVRVTTFWCFDTGDDGLGSYRVWVTPFTAGPC